MSKRDVTLNLALIAAAIISAGCNISLSSFEPTKNAFSTQIGEPAPIASPLPIETPAQLLLQTPIASQIPDNEPDLPTVVPVPNLPTVEPTLLPDEAEAYVLNLLQGDDDCLFPCWWGALPDQTRWEEVEPFLTRFAAEIIVLESIRTNNPLETIEIHVTVPTQISPTGQLIMFYTTRNGVIEYIEAEVGTSETYELSQVLATYGMPSDVWFSTYGQSRDNNLPFRTLILYLDQGFVVSYFDNAEKINGNIMGCFQKSNNQYARIWLWNPEDELNSEEVFDISPLVDQTQTYFPLREATDLELSDFYEIFKDVSSGSCIQTPANLWPSP
ncbi:MAG: hypothetical protein IT327_31730 [Anaerolineae bacterium]|nr:hypothetical protein [Anaerolineae bacterium]